MTPGLRLSEPQRFTAPDRKPWKRRNGLQRRNKHRL